jgi:signal transduction histidine kinase
MPDFGLTPRERLVPRRLLVHFSGSGSGLPGLHMDRVLGALRPAFLLAVLAATPGARELVLTHAVGLAALAGYLAVSALFVFERGDPEEPENQRRQMLLMAELFVLILLVFAYGFAIRALFVLFFFPLVGFFTPVTIRTSLFTAFFLSALHVGLLQAAAPEDDVSGISGTLLLLVLGVLVGYLGEQGRWNSVQIKMLRRCGEILRRDVSFDELLSDLLREIAVYHPVERVILVSSDVEGAPGRLKQARSTGAEVFYEEIEFLREEVQYLFPAERFNGFYVNRAGSRGGDELHYDFLERRTIQGPLELPRIFYTLFNVRSVLSTPVLRQDRSLGRLFLINRRQGRFTAKDLHFLKQLCDRHLRPVLENLQLIRKSQALAVLEERNRIAMDLHDSFIQTLATVDVRLEVGRRILEKDVPGGLDEMRRISQMVKSEYLELRRYMNRLRHHVADGRLLEEALAEFVRRFQDDHGLPVEMKVVRGSGALAETLRGEILQIVREGLTNVARHAAATRALVNVEVGEDAVTIRIEDDGRGMPAGNGDGRAAIRPWTILQRTERLAGQLQVDSAPGEGTCISVSIPLRRTS